MYDKMCAFKGHQFSVEQNTCVLAVAEEVNSPWKLIRLFLCQSVGMWLTLL